MRGRIKGRVVSDVLGLRRKSGTLFPVRNFYICERVRKETGCSRMIIVRRFNGDTGVEDSEWREGPEDCVYGPCEGGVPKT